MSTTPIWFGPTDRSHFGWLHLPEDGQATGAVVLCPTMGLEALYSYWTLRTLAEQLTAAGYVVLRFDYDGTGDSAGSGSDPDRLGAWLTSVRTAIEYVQALKVGRVCLVGLRLGAVLAAADLARGGIVDDLVLWDPCASGRSFLREQRALWAFLQHQAREGGLLEEGASWGSVAIDETVDDGSMEMPGLFFDAPTVADLSALSIADCEGPLASRVLLLSRQERKPERKMAEKLAMAHVDSDSVEGQEALLEVTAVVPTQTLERIVHWICAHENTPVKITLPSEATQTATVVGTCGDGHPIVERPIDVGSGHLFGMLTEPEGGTSASEPTIVLLNAGLINHVGPGRLWVDLARRWAAQGRRCLRVDFSGIGDSPTRAGRKGQVVYSQDALIDLAEIRESIPGGDAHAVLIGLCSGGYHAIESALDHPVGALCAVNPVLTFFGPDGALGKGAWGGRGFEGREGKERTERQALSSTSNLIGSLGTSRYMRALIRRLPEQAWWIGNRMFVKAFPARTFERLVRLKVKVLIVAGTPEARQLRRGEQRLLQSLTASRRFHMETIPHLEHSLLERTGRQEVADLLTSFVKAHVIDERSQRRNAEGSSQGDPVPSVGSRDL